MKHIKQAYEVYSLVGGGYNKRHLHGYAWTKDDVKILTDKLNLPATRYHVGVVHLALVGSRWHRIHVIPVSSIVGEVAYAEDSRIAQNDIPESFTPSINLEVDGESRRLGLDLEKTIDLIASYPEGSQCKLYTLRTGGALPLRFKVRDLLKSDHTQRQVFEWLHSEIAVRRNQLNPM